MVDIERQEEVLLKHIKGRINDLLRRIRDLQRLDAKEEREKIAQRLIKEEVQEIRELIRALYDWSIIGMDLARYVVLLIEELKLTAGPQAYKLEKLVILDMDQVRKNVSNILTTMERLARKEARR